VLGVPVAEVARKLGVNRSVIFRLKQSEGRGTISLRAMTRVANAMNCKVVYRGDSARWEDAGGDGGPAEVEQAAGIGTGNRNSECRG